MKPALRTPSYTWHGQNTSHSWGCTGGLAWPPVSCGPLPAVSQSHVACVFPQLVSESCPRLAFLKLLDCHGITADILIMLAKTCGQLHSLNLQHSMVSPVSQGALKKTEPG